VSPLYRAKVASKVRIVGKFITFQKLALFQSKIAKKNSNFLSTWFLDSRIISEKHRNEYTVREKNKHPNLKIPNFETKIQI
jgi:hypothetical protein